MKEYLLRHALGVLLVLALAAPAAGEGVFPYPVRNETLDNGLKVVLVPMESGGLVAYWTVVRTGARDEYEPGRTGFAHFFEHMMFRGTEKYPGDVYNAKVTSIGAETNAYTGEDITAYHLGIAAEDLDLVMDLESDRFQNLSYPEEGFKTEAGAIYGEFRKNRANPFFMLYEASRAAAFKTHTYGHTAMGYEDDIKAMPTLFDYSKTFFDRYYRPENIVLLIVGDIDPDAVLGKVKQYYGAWKKGYVAPSVPSEPEQTGERRVDVAYPGSSLPILWLAYKSDAFDPTNRELIAADLLCQLVFGETGDLYRKLVLDEKKVEFVAAEFNQNRDPGLIDVYSRIKDQADIDTVLGEIDAALAKAAETPPDAKRLEDLKSRLRYSFLMGLDTPDAVANGLARFLAVTGSVESVDQLYQTYAEITPDDVVAAARKYFSKDRRTVAILKGAE